MTAKKTKTFNTICLISALFILFSASGCSLYRIDSADTTMELYLPKFSDDEIPYIENITKPYTVIATVTVNTERVQKLDDVIEKMQREAAILGGDAITNIRTNAGTGRWARLKPKKLFGNAHIRVNIVGDVIVFD